MILISICNRS